MFPKIPNFAFMLINIQPSIDKLSISQLNCKDAAVNDIIDLQNADHFTNIISFQKQGITAGNRNVRGSFSNSRYDSLLSQFFFCKSCLVNRGKCNHIFIHPIAPLYIFYSGAVEVVLYYFFEHFYIYFEQTGSLNITF